MLQGVLGIDPRLVKVDDAPAGIELLQHHLGVVLAQEQAARRVAEVGDPLDALEAGADVVAEDAAYIAVLDLYAALVLDGPLELGGGG